VVVEKVVVLGAGVMGVGITQSLAISGFSAVCMDISETAVDRAESLLLNGRFGLMSALERRIISESDFECARSRVTMKIFDEGELEGADLVIEAIPENLAMKIDLFLTIDSLMSQQAILASNTSGFSIEGLAACTSRPSRVVGWHWASPPPVMKFAEIVKHAKSDPEVIRVVVEVASKCGKHPIVVNDQPRAWGFVANRVYFAMIAEAKRVVEEDIVAAHELDKLMVDCFGWPIGPLAMEANAHLGWEMSSTDVAVAEQMFESG